MTLAWPAFEKRLRRALRARFKASPDLRREARKRRKSSTGQTSSRLLFTTLGLLIFTSLASHLRNPEFVLAIITLWTAGLAFRKARQWFQTFYSADDLVVLNLLPVSDESIFRLQSRKFARRFGWTFFELTFLYLTLGLLQKSWEPLIFLAPLIALVQTALIFSLSLHFVVFLHALPLAAISNLLCLTALLLLAFGSQTQVFNSYLIQFSYWFFPTGWLNYAFVQSFLRQDWITALLVFPVGAIIYAGLYSWHRLRAFYNLDALELLPHPGLFGHDTRLASRGATEIQDTIGEGGFRRALDWPGSGWLERWISKSLHGRDRLVLEFLVAENPGWTRALKGALWVFLLGSAIVYTFGHHGGFLAFLPAWFVAAAALPIFGGMWRGLQALPSSGVYLPLHALYPIALREMTRVMLRVNIYRTVAAAPLLLAFGVLAAWKLGDPLFMGWRITSKILGLFLALQPVIVLIPLSRSTNYTSRRAWLQLLLNVPIFVSLILLSIAFFLASAAAHTLLLLAAVLLLALVMHALYHRAFNRGRIDLLHTQPDSINQ